MGRRRCRASDGGATLVGLATFAALGVFARQSHAEPVRVSYVAPAGCLDQADFVHRVGSHTDRLELAEPGSLARVLDVRIVRVGDGYSARLEFVDARRERIIRQIRGASCDEVANALALAVALLVEAEPPGPQTAAPELEEEHASSRSEAVADSPPSPPSRSPTGTSLAPQASPGASWSLSFSGRASSQIAPDPVYGFALGVSRFRSWEPGVEAASGWRVALDGSYQDSGPVTFEQTSLRFRLLGVRARLCAAEVLRSPVFAELCAAGEGGYWRATAERSARLTDARSASAAWAALGLPVSFGVSLQGLELFVSGGPWFPLVRQRFTFSHPDSVVHEVNPVSVSVDLGLRLAL